MPSAYRVAAPSIRIVPLAALASCWPLPQQPLPVSATGGGRRCCTLGIFSGKLFLISRLSRPAGRSKRIFTGGVVKGTAAAYFSVLALSVAARQLPRRGSPWHNGTVFGFARASPFGRGGTAQAVTERARMLAANEPSQSVIFFSIPRFLPVENSLRLCYDRKQRIFPKIDSEEGNGSCVKVVF